MRAIYAATQHIRACVFVWRVRKGPFIVLACAHKGNKHALVLMARAHARSLARTVSIVEQYNDESQRAREAYTQGAPTTTNTKIRGLISVPHSVSLGGGVVCVSLHAHAPNEAFEAGDNDGDQTHANDVNAAIRLHSCVAQNSRNAELNTYGMSC